MSEKPRSYADLRTALQARMPSLAPGQRRIAEMLLSDPEGTAFRTIGEAAAVADVHKSSLVRFAEMLGLSGYPAVVALCREQLAERAQLVRRFDRAEQLHDTVGLLNAVVEHDQQNLARTFALILPSEWEKAVAWLAETPRIHIMGTRKCLAVAQLMSYLLRLVRPGVHLVAPTTGGLVDELRELQPHEVFVGVSIRRYTAETVRAMQYAQQCGLHTIALTDDWASPLAACGDVTFYIESRGVTILRSVSAFISLAQALSTAVALRAGTRSRAELREDEALLDLFDVYIADPDRTATTDPRD